MKRVLVGIGIAAVIALCSAPVMAGSLRHGSGGGGGGEGDSHIKKLIDDNNKGDSDAPMAAVPEPGAGLVFAAGALVIASRLRRKRS